MNSYFILSLVSMLAAIAIVALKVCYASKCDKVKICWGLVQINREVEYESSQLDNPSVSNIDQEHFRQKKILKSREVEKEFDDQL